MKNFDKEFLKRLKNQDHDAFNEFYLKSVDMFFRYTKSNYFLPDTEIEDVVSLYYVKQRDAFKNLDISKSFSAYVWTIFKNTLKDHFKKMTDISFSSMTNDEDSGSFEDTLEHDEDMNAVLELDFQLQHIQDALIQLDDLSRDIIHFKFVEDKSHDEIAEILGITNDNVRQKSSRAIKQLKTLIDKL